MITFKPSSSSNPKPSSKKLNNRSKYITYIAILLSVLSISFLVISNITSKYQILKNNYSRVLQSSGDVSLPANSFNIGTNYNVNYDLNTTAGTITMAIKFNTANQFFALGFGSDMVGSDIMAFEISGSTVTATARKATDYLYAPVDSSYNLQLLGYELTSSYTLVKVKRALNTGDSSDKVITAGTTSLVWATCPGSQTMSYHGTNKGVVGTTLVASSSDSTPVVSSTVDIEVEVYRTGIQKAHTITNIIAWGLLSDVGIIIIRVMKGKNIGFISAHVAHMLIMSSAVIMSLVTVAMVIEKMFDPMQGIQAQRFHYINGLVLIGLMSLTTLGGFANYLTVSLKKINVKTKVTLGKWMHALFGALLYLLVKANLITGAYIYGKTSLKAVVYTYVAVMMIIHIFLEGFIRYYKSYTNKFSAAINSEAKPLKEAQHPLVKAINDGASREQLFQTFPNISWVILGNKIYNLTYFTHPGGNFIINQVVGRDVGRYFFGNYSLEGSSLKPHQHSGLATSKLKSYYMGDITNYESVLLRASEKSAKGSPSLTSDKEIWSISGISRLTPTISQVIFNVKDSDLLIKPLGFTMSSLGRHFRISFNKDQSPGRLYTIALALNPANIEFRKNLFDYFDRIMTAESINDRSSMFNFNPAYLNPQENIAFYIKNYPSKGGLSRAIHELNMDNPANSFRVQGPLGRGLELTNESTGSHCIIVGGTGILPFIDFLNLFLLKNMYDLIKKNAGVEAAQRINVFNLPLDYMMNGMKITLVGSFKGDMELIGGDIIKKLVMISKTYGLNNFDAILRGATGGRRETVKRFDKKFIVEEVGATYDKYYVVGPPAMNMTVPMALEALGVSKNKIHLV